MSANPAFINQSSNSRMKISSLIFPSATTRRSRPDPFGTGSDDVLSSAARCKGCKKHSTALKTFGELELIELQAEHAD
jgi:hypothetical protein